MTSARVMLFAALDGLLDAKYHQELKENVKKAHVVTNFWTGPSFKFRKSQFPQLVALLVRLRCGLTVVNSKTNHRLTIVPTSTSCINLDWPLSPYHPLSLA